MMYERGSIAEGSLDLVCLLSMVALMMVVLYAPGRDPKIDSSPSGTKPSLCSPVPETDVLSKGGRPEPALVKICRDGPLQVETSSVQPGPEGSIPKKTPPEKGSNRSSASERIFLPLILEASSRHKVDPALIRAIIRAESGYDAKAVSRNGAAGLMQLMPHTAKALGVKDIFDPKHNIDAGVRYFRQLLTEFHGDLRLALAAYNAGSRKVRKFQGIPPFQSTRSYIQKVFDYYRAYVEQDRERRVELAKASGPELLSPESDAKR